MLKSIATSCRLGLASNIHLCVPGEQKEDFNDSTEDKDTCGWRRPAGDPPEVIYQESPSTPG